MNWLQVIFFSYFYRVVEDGVFKTTFVLHFETRSRAPAQLVVGCYLEISELTFLGTKLPCCFCLATKTTSVVGLLIRRCRGGYPLAFIVLLKLWLDTAGGARTTSYHPCFVFVLSITFLCCFVG